MHKALFVFGTRPEAIKLAPVIKCFRDRARIQSRVCVTGQHREMLSQALRLFGIAPDYDLDVMRPDQDLSSLTAQLFPALDRVLLDEKPDITIVQGDTTSAMVGALTAFYHRVPVAHVEAGLRTGDKYNPFPEEINRVIIDRIADLHFAPTSLAAERLLNEGVNRASVHVTGNTVVDALRSVLERVPSQAVASDLAELPAWLSESSEDDGGRRVVLITGHRRESFGKDLEAICMAIREIAQRNPDVDVVYPVHFNPNVREPVNRLLQRIDNVHLIDPLNYAAFVRLMSRSYLVVTDSGGVQEEVVSLGKPTLVTRKVTERPEGIQAGVAVLVGVDKERIVSTVQHLLDDRDAYVQMASVASPYGDGDASERIEEITYRWLEERIG